MHEVSLDSWEDLERQLKGLTENHAAQKQKALTHVSGILFRGHADHTWRLTTSLERHSNRRFSIDAYYRIISAVKPQLESLTKTRWNIPTPSEFSSMMKQRLPFLLGGMPGYEYMVHLRHHGFPSPLLDWTRSPYVAAFFAFDAVQDRAKMVSIFAYQEYAGSGKSSSGNEATISGLGHTSEAIVGITFNRVNIRFALSRKKTPAITHATSRPSEGRLLLRTYSGSSTYPAVKEQRFSSSSMLTTLMLFLFLVPQKAS